LGATRRKALATQNRAAGLGLEGHAVGLPALIANYLEAFALAAASGLAWAAAAEIRAARVAARLAAFRMSQTALAIIILLSFCKGKSRSALGTVNFQIWHGFSPRVFSVKG
jgi:hypothetical protein